METSLSLPANLEAEQALIGAIFANNRALDAITERLQPQHFADPLHGRMFELALRRHERGEEANAVTLYQFFEGEDISPDLSVKTYLAQLQGNYIPVANAPDYANTVLNDALRRDAIMALQDAGDELIRPDIEEAPETIVDRLQGRLDGAVAGSGYEAPRPFHAVLAGALGQAERVYKADGEVVGIPTGLSGVDAVTTGLHKGQLVVIAGRPSMGKSALAETIARNAAMGSCRVAMFSLEMSMLELGTRAMARATGIDSNDIRGNVTSEIMDALFAAKRDLQDLPIFIDDSPGLTVSQMRSRARRHRRQHGLDLVIVDYLQLMQGSRDRRRDGRVQEISEITRDLKAMAKYLDVPVIALSQLSRAVEQREDKRPQLSDLRESGTIEQDADVVMFLYREEYYLQREQPQQRANESDEAFHKRTCQHGERLMKARGLAEIVLAKQRNGAAPRQVKVRFDGKRCVFENLNDHAASQQAMI